MDVVKVLLLGVISSLIAAIAIRLYKGRKSFLYERKIRSQLNKALLKEGVSKFHFSRDDYTQTLSSFLSAARNSIEIVSISFKVQSENGKLVDLFRKKLASSEHFFIRITLPDPRNLQLIKLIANSLDIPPHKLKFEILDMLDDLLQCRNHLSIVEKSRFKIFLHDCFPFGSAILLDSTWDYGVIQVETKLFKSPRNDSFGFVLSDPDSEFYKRNYIAWNRIFLGAKELAGYNVDSIRNRSQ